jgi:hypothetical protein
MNCKCLKDYNERNTGTTSTTGTIDCTMTPILSSIYSLMRNPIRGRETSHTMEISEIQIVSIKVISFLMYQILGLSNYACTVKRNLCKQGDLVNLEHC